jgi:hypothetical protein
MGLTETADSTFDWREVGAQVTPIGSTSSIESLRLKGVALACLVQSGLKAICGTLR